MSMCDFTFIYNLHNLVHEGWSDNGTEVRPHWKNGKPAHTKKLFGVVNTYDLRNEFPILTIKKVPIKNCVDEILWIYQKKSNKLSDLRSHIWDAWADENGTIGKAYGYQMGKKYDWGGGQVMDQVDKLLWDIKHNPGSRRIITTMWNPEDLKDMQLQPCAFMTTWSVQGKYLNMMLNQRSQDVMTANGWNVTQYAALLCIVAHCCGLIPAKFIHVIADYHLYDMHEHVAHEILRGFEPFDEQMYELMQKKSFETPAFAIRKSVNNFYDFTLDDFMLGVDKEHPDDYVKYPANAKAETYQWHDDYFPKEPLEVAV